VLVLLLSTPAAAKHKKRHPKPGVFDYYVLSLSWSPDYCATHHSRRGRRVGESDPQCGSERHFGFVVHGLWPQYNRGYPQSCSIQARPPQDVIDGVIDIMPSETLIQHEWAKHGTCDGSDAAGYFAKVRSAYSSIKVPGPFEAPTSPRQTTLGAIRQDFLKSNPDVSARGIAVVCDGRFLEEVHVCLDRELRPRACGNDVKDRCSGGSVTVRPVG